MSHFTSHWTEADETNSIIAVSRPAHVAPNLIRPVCTHIRSVGNRGQFLSGVAKGLCDGLHSSMIVR